MIPYVVHIYVMICLLYDVYPNHTLSIATILHMFMNLQHEPIYMKTNATLNTHNLTDHL